MAEGSSSPFVSVIVPAHNRAGPLEACLSTLSNQQYDDGRWEVIVVDDGSCDGTGAMLARVVAGTMPLCCLRHEERRGSGPSRNTALACARGEIVLFLDSDTLAPPWLLREHALSHRGRRCYVNGPAIGVRVRGAVGPRPFRSPRVRLLAALDFGGSRLVTANVSCRRDELAAAGEFDTAFGPRYGWEDTELGVRLRARGVGWVKNRRAFVLHQVVSGYDWRERGRKQREAGENAAYFRAKHPTREVTRVTKGRPLLAGVLSFCGLDADRTARACARRAPASTPSWPLRQAYEIQQYARGLQAGREGACERGESCRGPA